MNMEVAPVMMPDQQMPQGQQMMQGTPAPPDLPEQLPAQLNTPHASDNNEPNQPLQQIHKLD